MAPAGDVTVTFGAVGSTDDTIVRWLDRAIEAALRAGVAIREVYGSEFTVEQKEDRSPLTEADRRAHAI